MKVKECGAILFRPRDGVRKNNWEYTDIADYERIRITRRNDNDKTYDVISMDNGKKFTISFNEADNEWTYLSPDGVIIFSIVEYDKMKDILVCLFNNNHPDMPAVICRQCVVDVFAMYGNSNKNVVGLSVSNETCPHGIDFASFLGHDKLIESRTVVVYNTDTLDDILSFNTKKYDKILSFNKMMFSTNPRYGIGWCGSLKELLHENKFMQDFHLAFGIEEVPFSIKDFDNKTLVSDDGISKWLYDIIAERFNVYPSSVIVKKYDKTIDIHKMECRNMLITADSYKCNDDDRDIYILGCHVDPDRTYVEYKYGDEEHMRNRLKELGFN